MNAVFNKMNSKRQASRAASQQSPGQWRPFSCRRGIPRRGRYYRSLWPICGLILVWVLAGCTQPAPLATPAPATATPESGEMAERPPADSAALSGRIPGAVKIWPGESITVYAAPFFGPDEASGFFMLDPDRHPHAALGPGGAFRLEGLAPGRYVLVAGPRPMETRAVVDDEGKARLFQAGAGSTAELGDLNLAE